MFQIIILLVLCMQTSPAATSCQVYPSEYAYRENSVAASEHASANCRMYPSGLDRILGIHSADYVHCNGKKLRLADSEVGPRFQYDSSYHYEWSNGTEIKRLLFILPKAVNLTTITLHYYSNVRRSLPSLRFYAQPDDFDVWDAQPGNSIFVDVAAVPHSGQPGLTNVTTDVNFKTKKVLVVIATRSHTFAASEVEFFQEQTGNNQTSCLVTSTTSTVSSSTTQTDNTSITPSAGKVTITEYHTVSATTFETMAASTTDNVVSSNNANNGVYLAVAIIVIAIVLLLTTVVITVVVILVKKTAKQKMKQESAYCALSRSGSAQHQVSNDTSDTYDQIKLSPLTGQAEFVSNEPENIRNISQQQHHNHPTHPNTASYQSAQTLQYQHAQTEPGTAPSSESQQDDKPSSKSEQPTYAVVNQKLKKKATRKKPDPNENTEGIDGEFDTVQKKETKEDITEKEITATNFATRKKPVEELYAAVNKKPKAKKSEKPPPIPAHTVEELYTAVNKIPKVSTATKEEEEAPPIPPHTVEELYTAVNKTPKGNVADNEEEAPPIPLYNIEGI